MNSAPYWGREVFGLPGIGCTNLGPALRQEGHSSSLALWLAPGICFGHGDQRVIQLAVEFGELALSSGTLIPSQGRTISTVLTYGNYSQHRHNDSVVLRILCRSI